MGWKFQNFMSTLTPQTLSQQSPAIVSSKQFPSTLKIKKIDAHKQGTKLNFLLTGQGVW